MDLSFAFRRRNEQSTGTPDLDSLLSRAAARASTTPTAQTAARLDGGEAALATDPHIAMFAEGKSGAARGGAFASLPQTVVTRRKPK